MVFIENLWIPLLFNSRNVIIIAFITIIIIFTNQWFSLKIVDLYVKSMTIYRCKNKYFHVLTVEKQWLSKAFNEKHCFLLVRPMNFMKSIVFFVFCLLTGTFWPPDLGAISGSRQAQEPLSSVFSITRVAGLVESDLSRLCLKSNRRIPRQWASIVQPLRVFYTIHIHLYTKRKI